MKAKLNLLIKQVCKLHNLTLIEEFRFNDLRRWRADWFIPELNVLIEYEGMGRGKYGTLGGHQTIDGYTANCDKYNAASIAGFVLLRYTARNYGNVLDDLKVLFNDAR
jgi:hypothetical protein